MSAEVQDYRFEHENDRASRLYPSVEFTSGHRLHVFMQGGVWDVWLNTEVGDFDGLCLAADGATRDEAVAQAVQVLEAALEKLHGPPWVEAVETGRDFTG